MEERIRECEPPEVRESTTIEMERQQGNSADTPPAGDAVARSRQAELHQAALIELDPHGLDEEATQFDAIRKLMLSLLGSGAWLTLGEIARATQFGEASISAQLRHLRKEDRGRYRVEKRRRKTARRIGSTSRRAGGARRRRRVVWEYRVLPPA